MNAYRGLAASYDGLQSEVDYAALAKSCVELFSFADIGVKTVLDLACGTGTLLCELAGRGYETIGTDGSPDMLSVAAQKCADLPDGCVRPLLLGQTMEELDLYGTVDGAVCLMDSLNHITDYEDFCKAISKVSLFLEKDRLFIFDVNTEYKAENILGDNSFVSEDDNIFLAWQNEYDKSKGINSIYLDFFIPQKDGKYERKSENIIERTYSDTDIRKALKIAGLDVIAVFDDMKKTPPTNKSQRVFYITKKL